MSPDALIPFEFPRYQTPRVKDKVATMSGFRSVIQRFRAGQADENCWLYIAGDGRNLTLETDADLGTPEIDETGDEIHPPGFEERGLWPTIDKQTVDACIEWADRLAGTAADEAAADVIRYYIRFDAWPESLHAPDPPSAGDGLDRIDRDFCDKLGPEDSTRRCRRQGCVRGAVSLSVLCRRHHFETICGRPYPFDD